MSGPNVSDIRRIIAEIESYTSDVSQSVSQIEEKIEQLKVFNSKDLKVIADVLCVKKSKFQYWVQSHEWTKVVSYWAGTPPTEGNLNLVKRRWTELVENNEDLFSINYPDMPENIKHAPEFMDLSTLIRTHLFCIDNLCDDEIRAHLAEEREFGLLPVQYEGHKIGSRYHWWIYPNYDEGLYSKILARINFVEDLVIGSGEETCLVIIRHGRLTIARKYADDVASAYDKRLLVCL
ncbi:hypothetical protein F4Z99_18700 [Candidatus Poribacteria bacterium]|nr:hypothetical protein [Candidatus Poribacteria bacterium]